MCKPAPETALCSVQLFAKASKNDSLDPVPAAMNARTKLIAAGGSVTGLKENARLHQSYRAATAVLIAGLLS
jgi:hypothetical protein